MEGSGMGEEKDREDEFGKLRMVNDKLVAENARLATEN